jgi:hypothetical protein
MCTASCSRSSRALGAAGVLLGLAISGCASDDLPERYRLGGLRTLALQAAASEVADGGSTTVTPLVSDFGGGSRTVSYVAEACLDPGVAYGAEPTCTGSATFQALGVGTVTFLDSRRTVAAPAVPITVPAGILAGRPSEQQANGVAVLFIYRLTADADTSTAFRRIIVTSRAALNANPDITGATVDGAAFTALPTVEKRIRPTFGAGPQAESYTLQFPGGATETRTEELSISWFVAFGELRRSILSDDHENTYTPPAGATSRNPFLVLVLRDDRGGVDWVGIPDLTVPSP